MRRVLLILFCLFLGLAAHSQNLYLLSVGVSDYPGVQNDLKLPVNDARAIVELYKSNRAATTRILLDQAANRQAILDAARELYSKAKADDIVVFYFSGHGCPSGFVAQDEKILQYSDLKAVFSRCSSKHKMIFADSCFSGKLRDAGPSSSSSSKTDMDLMLFLSSRHNEVSLEVPGMKNGFFTACLLKCLKGAADENRDRRVTAKELFKGVSMGVRTLSQDTQHPVMWGNFADDMTVMKW